MRKNNGAPWYKGTLPSVLCAPGPGAAELTVAASPLESTHGCIVAAVLVPSFLCATLLAPCSGPVLAMFACAHCTKPIAVAHFLEICEQCHLLYLRSATPIRLRHWEALATPSSPHPATCFFSLRTKIFLPEALTARCWVDGL